MVTSPIFLSAGAQAVKTYMEPCPVTTEGLCPPPYGAWGSDFQEASPRREGVVASSEAASVSSEDERVSLPLGCLQTVLWSWVYFQGLGIPRIP